MIRRHIYAIVCALFFPLVPLLFAIVNFRKEINTSPALDRLIGDSTGSVFVFMAAWWFVFGSAGFILGTLIFSASRKPTGFFRGLSSEPKRLIRLAFWAVVVYFVFVTLKNTTESNKFHAIEGAYYLIVVIILIQYQKHFREIVLTRNWFFGEYIVYFGYFFFTGLFYYKVYLDRYSYIEITGGITHPPDPLIPIPVSFIIFPFLIAVYLSTFTKKGKQIQKEAREESQRQDIREAYGAREIASFTDLRANTHHYGFYVGAPYWHWFGDGHILTIGETGDGKNASIILPGLLSSAFLETGTSVFCLDPKGENYYICHEQMERNGYNTYRINPADILSMGSDYFNLFDMIDQNSPDAYAFCKTIASSLCPVGGRNDTSDHFNKKARIMLTFYMLYMIDTEGSSASFITLYEWVTYGDKKRVGLLEKMSQSKAFEGVVASGANGMLTGFGMGGEREMSGVYSSAEVSLESFSNPQTRRVMRQSNFSLRELIDKPTAIFINVPFGEIKDSSGWIRSIIGVLSRMMEMRQDRQRRLLFMLDEFTRLGHVSEVEEGFVALRSFGVTYHIVVQDMQQLKKNYPGSEKSFFSSSAVINALKVKDAEMAKILSDMTGKDVNTVSMGENHAPHIVHKQVVTPDEFQNNNDNHYLFLKGMPNVIKLPKVFYFRNKYFDGMWRQNPYH